MDIGRVTEELEANSPRAVYVLTGSEQFRLDQAVRGIRRATLDDKTASWNTDQFQGKGTKASAVLAAAKTPPMLGARRLVIVRGADELAPEEQEALARYLDTPCPTTTLLLIAEKLDGRKRLATAARGQGALFEATPIADRQIPDWIRKRARQLGHEIDGPAALALFELVGNDLCLLADALERLSLFVGEKHPITSAAVSECVAPLRSGNVFALMEAIGNRDTPLALTLLGQLLDAREAPLKILWWISRHIRQLAIAREVAREELPQRIGVPPFVADKLARQARSLSEQTLIQGLRSLAQADLELKSARRDDRLVLEETILAMCLAVPAR